MRLRRRRRTEGGPVDGARGSSVGTADAPGGREATLVAPRHSAARRRAAKRNAGAGAAPPAVRAERVIVALAVHAQQIDGRLARIEARLDDSDAAASRAAEQQAMETVSHDELLEVRLHSARLAAELARVSVELQGRVDELAAEQRRRRREDTFADSVLDLSGRLYDDDVIDLRDPPSSGNSAASF